MSTLPSAPIKIFSSHAWGTEYRPGLHGLLSPWLRRVDFEDYSVSERHPLHVTSNNELKRRLALIIADTDVFLIFGSMHIHWSGWMDFELNCAKYFNKPVLVVVPNGQERVPLKLQTLPRVYWRSQSVRRAIWESLPLWRQRGLRAAGTTLDNSRTDNFFARQGFQPPPPLPNTALARAIARSLKAPSLPPPDPTWQRLFRPPR